MMSVVQANLLCGYEVRMIREWKIVQSPRTQKSYGIFAVSQQLRLFIYDSPETLNRAAR